jgi:hypothetical protein
MDTIENENLLIGQIDELLTPFATISLPPPLLATFSSFSLSTPNPSL